jgi:hypothetical protein
MRTSQEKYGAHPGDDLNGKFTHLVEDVQALVDKTLVYFGAKKEIGEQK